MKIGADDLINQIADTLCEVDVDFLCEVANKVLAATHTAAGEDDHGYDLIEQNSNQGLTNDLIDRIMYIIIRQ